MLRREKPSCWKCHSSLRSRSVVNALSICLFRDSITVNEFPSDSRRGIALSDEEGVVKRLARSLNYENTYYHKEPLLDLRNIDGNQKESLDYIVCSEVLEHIVQPIEDATRNIFHLLKKGGFAIITVPYNTGGPQDGPTIEHFPDLYDFDIFRSGNHEQRGVQDSQVLVNITKDGERQEFADLAFHGGEGVNLEMRQFTKKSLTDLLLESGFSRVENIDSDFKEFGIEFLGEFEGQVDKEPVVAWK